MDRHLTVFNNPESYAFFEQQSQVLKDLLLDAEKQLEAFKRKNNLSSLDEQRSLLLKEYSALNADHNLTQSQLVETNHRLVQLSMQIEQIPRTMLQIETVDHNPFLINSVHSTL